VHYYLTWDKIVSAHSYNFMYYNNLKSQPIGHLKRVVVKRTNEDVKRNRL
jgi:hypothetical protein